MLDLLSAVNLSPPVVASQKTAASAATIQGQESTIDSFDVVLKKSFESKVNEKSFEKKRSYKEDESEKTEDYQPETENFGAVSQEQPRRSDEIDSGNNEESTDSTVSQESTAQVSQYQESEPTVEEQLSGKSSLDKFEEKVNSILQNQNLGNSNSVDSGLTNAKKDLAGSNPVGKNEVLVETQTNVQADTQILESETQFLEPKTQIPELTMSEKGNETINAEQLITDQTLMASENQDSEISSKKNQVSPELINVGKDGKSQQNTDTVPIKIETAGEIQTQTSNTNESAGLKLDIKDKTNINENSVDSTSSTAETLETTGTSTTSEVFAASGNSQVKEPVRLAEAQKSQIVSQVTEQLDGMLKSNNSSIRMQLYPEELGHIDLMITSTKDGVGVTLIADKAATQQVLSSEMNTLRQNMEQAGIQVASMNIANDQTNNSQTSYQERREFSKQTREYQGNSSSQVSSIENMMRKVSLQTSEIDYRV